ncbi:MAG: hypothetical protein R6V17_06100 [Halanaerobacter sp.]
MRKEKREKRKELEYFQLKERYWKIEYLVFDFMSLNLIIHSPLSILNYDGGGSKFTFVFSIMN